MVDEDSKKKIYEVGPRFEDVMNYSTDSKTGGVDTRKLESFRGRYGLKRKNCDVLEGPCSCGAWH